MREVPADLARKLFGAADRIPVSFDDVRMDDIAAASGIPRATLYYYFAGKDDILAFILDALRTDLREKVEKVLDLTIDTRTLLSRVLRTQLELFTDTSAATQLLLLNLGKVGKIADLAAGGDRTLANPIRQVLEQGVRRGELENIDIDTKAYALSGAVHYVGTRAAITEPGIDTNQLATTLTDLFWDGMRKPNSAGNTCDGGNQGFVPSSES